MKNYFKLIAIGAILASTSYSCKSDLDLDNNLKFSKLTVEEQKEKLESNGLEFIDIAEGLKETKAYKTLTDFGETAEVMMVPEVSILKSVVLKPESKSMMALHAQIVQREEDEIWGEYTWNEDLQEMEQIASFTGNDKKLIVHFPADANDTGNNATLNITYKESDVEVPEEDDVYMPESIEAFLEVYKDKVIEASYSSTYKSDGTPLEMKSALSIDDYSWKMDMSNTTDEFKENYELKYKKDVLVKLSAKATGDLTYNNLEASDGPGEVFDEVAVAYQMMDLSILGGVKDVKAFEDEINDVDYEDKRAGYDQECEIINKHLILYAYFNDDNKKFADVEFYVSESTDSYLDYEWNGWEYEEILVEHTNYEILPRMVMGDGSKVDMADYFETGFDQLIDKLEDSFSEFE